MSEPNTITDLFSIRSILLDMPVGSPRRALELASAVLAQSTGAGREELFQALFENTRLGTPWVRRGMYCLSAAVRSLEAPAAAFVRFAEPIEIDGVRDHPVFAALLLVLPPGQAEQRQRIGLELSSMLSDEALRGELLGSDSPRRILEQISCWNAPQIVAPQADEIR